MLSRIGQLGECRLEVLVSDVHLGTSHPALREICFRALQPTPPVQFVGKSRHAGTFVRIGRYADLMTPEQLEKLAHLRRARDLMDREYEGPLDIKAIARTAFMSPAHFSRQFKAAYGETPYSYLMTRRVERAKALLRRGDLSVTEVCMMVGCRSLGSFSARFTRLVGQTPSAYRTDDHRALEGVPGCIAKDITRPSSSRIGEAVEAAAS
jgi:AraC-like DNA-binding protein